MSRCSAQQLCVQRKKSIPGPWCASQQHVMIPAALPEALLLDAPAAHAYASKLHAAYSLCIYGAYNPQRAHLRSVQYLQPLLCKQTAQACNTAAALPWPLLLQPAAASARASRAHHHHHSQHAVRLTVVHSRSSSTWPLSCSHCDSTSARRQVALFLPSVPTSLSSSRLSRLPAGTLPGGGKATGAAASASRSSSSGSAWLVLLLGLLLGLFVVLARAPDACCLLVLLFEPAAALGVLPAAPEADWSPGKEMTGMLVAEDSVACGVTATNGIREASVDEQCMQRYSGAIKHLITQTSMFTGSVSPWHMCG